MVNLAKPRVHAAQKVMRQDKQLKEFSARAPQSNSAQLA
jgi:hypothetical protein